MNKNQSMKKNKSNIERFSVADYDAVTGFVYLFNRLATISSSA